MRTLWLAHLLVDQHRDELHHGATDEWRVGRGRSAHRATCVLSPTPEAEEVQTLPDDETRPSEIGVGSWKRTHDHGGGELPVDPLLSGLFKKFKQSNELEDVSESDAFEMFAAKLVLRSQNSPQYAEFRRVRGSR